MMRIAICDDDLNSQKQTKQLIHTWAERNDVSVSVLNFDNGDSLLDYCETEKIDIIFLDIMMPLLNGMDTAREIRKKDTAVKIIFLTASPEFAVESYDVKASGYLLKPVLDEKFFSLLDDSLHSMVREPEYLLIRTISGYQKIYLHNIECVEAQSRKVIFYLTEGNTTEAFGTFSGYAESMTQDKGFYKCHRSYMVNLLNIDHFNSSEILTRSGVRVPIARGLGKTFKEAYFAYMFRKERND